MAAPRYGYAGNILRVDLTHSRFSSEPTEDYAPRFLGGKGINQWILFRELGPWVTPFEPANTICFGAGALVGTLVPGAARLNVDSKNVLTGGIGSGSGGGWFAPELKFAGYDNLVVSGKAREPVYLWIEDDKIATRPAAPLWGKTTSETVKLIKEDVGQEDIQVLCIGPAGENLSKSACVVVSGARVVGRCGLGAVMGSKNLKAIAVKGSGGIGVKRPEAFLDLVEATTERLRGVAGASARREFGTLVVSPLYNKLSALSYKNFRDDHIPDEHLDRISHEVFHRRYGTGRYACASCPTPCGHMYFVDRGPYSGTRCFKAEANAVWNFGGKLAIDDVAAILKLQEECCQLGLDIDNASGAIGWAIDCFQEGILSKRDTDGLELGWGDHFVALELLRKIAHREGFGNILAEGSFRASQLVGKGSDRYAFHMKGQDLVEGIRSMKGWALGVVVSPRGGAHTRGAPATESRRFPPDVSQKLFGVRTAGEAATYEGKARIVCYFDSVHSLLDSLGVCLFTGNWPSPDGISPRELAQFYSLATGIETSEAELMRAGERIHNVEKMFNVYHAGFTRKDDYPPRRLMEEPVKSGPLRGERLAREDWDGMLDEYYALHGWDPSTGWPGREKLEELGLHECIERLEQAIQMHLNP